MQRNKVLRRLSSLPRYGSTVARQKVSYTVVRSKLEYSSSLLLIQRQDPVARTIQAERRVQKMKQWRWRREQLFQPSAMHFEVREPPCTDKIIRMRGKWASSKKQSIGLLGDCSSALRRPYSSPPPPLWPRAPAPVLRPQ